MRIRSALLLSRMFLLFILRRVLGRGILSSRSVRLGAGITTLLAFIGFGLMSFVVFKQYFGGTDLFEPILQVANASVTFWVLAVYTLVRVLFLKADELLELSFNLPVTNKERALALTIFEATIVLAATAFFFGAFSISTMLLEGPTYIPKVVSSIWFPAVTVYLLLSLGYFLLEQILFAVNLARLRGVIVPIALALGLAIVFPLVNEQSNDIVAGFVGGVEVFIPQMIYSVSLADFGLWAPLALFILTTTVLMTLIAAAAPRSYVPVMRFFKFMPSSLADSRFGAYILVLVRSFETGVVVSFLLIFSIFTLIKGIEMPPYVLILLTFQGIYSFSNSVPLRKSVLYPGSSLANYVCLIGSQYVLLGVVAIPMIAISSVQGIELSSSLFVLALCISNVLLSTFIGIIFPPEKGNPFSVLIGVVLTMIVVITVTLGLNLFNLSPSLNITAFLVLNVVVVLYSIVGMNRIERIARNEVVV